MDDPGEFEPPSGSKSHSVPPSLPSGSGPLALI